MSSSLPTPRSLTELLEQLFDRSWDPALSRFRSPYAFCGRSAGDHALSTGLFQLAGPADLRTVELALLRNFRKYAHHYAVNGVDSIWHWLALGQHHGLPTRLLDWTYSPLVALHFATQHLDDLTRDGVVWCVNFVEANKRLPRRLKRILDREHSQTLTIDGLAEFATLDAFDQLAAEPFVVFLEPPSLDARIMNQFALFSLMPDPAAQLDAWLGAHSNLVRRITVPARLKWEVRDKLDQANINERTLFPGLEGLSRWLARYYLPREMPATEQRPRALDTRTNKEVVRWRVNSTAPNDVGKSSSQRRHRKAKPQRRILPRDG